MIYEPLDSVLFLFSCGGQVDLLTYDCGTSL